MFFCLISLRFFLFAFLFVMFCWCDGGRGTMCVTAVVRVVCRTPYILYDARHTTTQSAF